MFHILSDLPLRPVNSDLTLRHVTALDDRVLVRTFQAGGLCCGAEASPERLREPPFHSEVQGYLTHKKLPRPTRTTIVDSV